MVVQGLLKDYAEQIAKHYGVSFDKDEEVEKVLEVIGKKKKLLKHKGLVDEDRAARMIIQDWQAGKIKI